MLDDYPRPQNREGHATQLPRSQHMGGLGYMHTISSTRGHLDLRPLGWVLADSGAWLPSPILPAIW